MHIFAYKFVEVIKIRKRKLAGGERKMGNTELAKTVYTLIAEIATREKKKAISIGDYGTALVAAIIEKMFAEGASAI